MTPALAAACERAIHLIRTDGAILRAGRAVLFIAGDLRWPRLCAVLARPPFVWAIELGYALVARHRRFFSRFLFRTAA